MVSPVTVFRIFQPSPRSMRAYFDDPTEFPFLERSGNPQKHFPEGSLVELHDEPDPG